MLFRKRSQQKQSAPTPEEEEALLLLEEEAFRAVAEARAKAKASPPPPEPSSAEIDAIEIEWEEAQEGIYHPESIVMGEFFAKLPDALRPASLLEPALLFVRRQAWKTVRTHLASNLKVEQGGLLTGRALWDADAKATILIVENAVIAPEGVETSHSFTYTSETWQAIFPQLQQMPANWTILGSYHSHPNMGVFLSRTDLETQADIFSQPWQIALVVDPVREEVGFFVGVKGVPCPHWSLIPDDLVLG